MLDQIERHFASAGRTPKGRRTLGAIYRATREAILDSGVADASPDAIASRCGLSQAALRHYFPTRDDLLASFFVSATAWYREQARVLLATGTAGPRDRLGTYVDWHLQYMETVDTALWLESSAYWLRRPAIRR
ncbi:MAG: TetR/AcrR family transcriptional regulator [Chromatiales bacterium]|nr:TetR/AcrR family transcriptional regulator [Chromatiales bacterium]